VRQQRRAEKVLQEKKAGLLVLQKKMYVAAVPLKKGRL
jgi:hypothetical protein